MYKIYPFVTNDGSMGLYSPEDNDIYHSVLGAATEAYEKFILPSDVLSFLKSHDKIKVLDICFGIGYNSKSFLNFIFQNKKLSEKIFSNKPGKILSPYNEKIDTNNTQSKTSNDTIYSDNIFDKEIAKNCSYTIGGYNNCNEKPITFHDLEKIFSKNLNIYIKAIDMDKNLAFLSPFIKPDIDINLPNQFENEKILKFSSKNKNFTKIPLKNLFDINKFIKYKKAAQSASISKVLTNYPEALNFYLLELITRDYPELIGDNDFIDLLFDKKYNGYFSKELSLLIKFKHFNRYKNNPLGFLCSFLHNIYYNHLTRRYKSDLKRLYSLGIDFCLKINDARLELQSDNNQYDFIFLDAFTPSKCPSLWTIDFFKQLFKHLSDDGVILTYSNSAPVRNAFITAGFFIGKIYNPIENRFTGTIATKNKSIIKYALSEYELGLLKTKSGIFYRDRNLSAPNEAIIAARKKEVEISNLPSASQYKKQFKEY